MELTVILIAAGVVAILIYALEQRPSTKSNPEPEWRWLDRKVRKGDACFNKLGKGDVCEVLEVRGETAIVWNWTGDSTSQYEVLTRNLVPVVTT